MNVIKILLLLLTTLILASFAYSETIESEYEAGRLHAYDFAKKDAWESDCHWSGSKILPGRKLWKHMETLRRQGKSGTFIKGFNFGYERTFWDQRDVKCSP